MANLLHDEVYELRKIINNEGITGAQRFIQEKMHVFNIAVTGISGSGKSSFVNSILGFEAAAVGVVETTENVKAYPHPKNENLIIFDLPGIGSPNFLKEKYCDIVQFSRYDFFVIILSGRFTELDLFLAKMVIELGKKYYFVRTKIDIDLHAERRRTRAAYNEKDILNIIREDCIRNLGRKLSCSCDIFLIDNYDSTKYDFPRLNRNIIRDAPLIKIDLRERILSSLISESYAKKKVFAKIESGSAAMKSALGGRIKVPRTSIHIDATCIREEIENYKQEFSLNEQSVEDYAALMNMSATEMTEIFNLRSLQMDFTENGILNACAELYPSSKINFPLVGSFLSSRSVVKEYLGKVIDQMSDDAIKMNMVLISIRRNEMSESISSSV